MGTDRSTALVVALACLTGVAAGAIQTRPALPSFAGTWVLQPPPNPEANFGGVTGGGLEMRIVQDASTLAITRPIGRGGLQAVGYQTFTVKLDGSDSPHVDSMPHRDGVTATIHSNASWQGNTLVIVTTTVWKENGKVTSTPEVRETLSRERSVLRVERSSPATRAVRRETYWKK